MVDLFSKMGDALESMEADIREMNACMKILVKSMVLEKDGQTTPLKME